MTSGLAEGGISWEEDSELSLSFESRKEVLMETNYTGASVLLTQDN